MLDIRNPIFTPDGSRVYFQRYEEDLGDVSSIYGATWSLASDGSGVPDLFETPLDSACGGQAEPVFDPATGDLVLEHSVCIDTSNEGFYLYGVDGTQKQKLVDTTSLTTWERGGGVHDCKDFLCSAFPQGGAAGAIYLVDPAGAQMAPLVVGSAGTIPTWPTLSPDDSHLVYCLRNTSTNAADLHVVDLTTTDLADTALTADGASCAPAF